MRPADTGPWNRMMNTIARMSATGPTSGQSAMRFITER